MSGQSHGPGGGDGAPGAPAGPSPTAQQPLEDEVLEILSSLIAFKNRADAKGWRDAFENMPVYMERVGLTEDEMRKLRVIHVAGTKGKGSTCAMVDSVLRACGYRTALYTSPHLVDVRERVRINGEMVSKEVFERQFWHCYDRFKATATADVGVPGYFRFITLLALKIFLEQQVDVVVLEVGVGGRLDATNIVPEPVVCGITSLGFDHMDMLGDTLPKIAREKAGILKPGRPGFTVSQPADALEALQDVAARVGAPLHEVGTLDAWAPDASGDQGPTLSMSLGGQHQRVNGGMAVQLCATFEEDSLARGTATEGARERVELLRKGVLPPLYARGLASTTWPGRSQVVNDEEFASPSPSSSRLSFYIDGAHTPESMVTCAEWFAGAVNAQPPAAGASEVERVLLFNCMKERDPLVLLPALSGSLVNRGVGVAHAVFVPPNSQYGFLATKRNPHPPSQHAAGASNGSAAPTGASNGQPPPPDYSWQVQLQGVWEAHCFPHHHQLLSKQGRAAQPLSPPGPPLPQVPGLPPYTPSKGAVAPNLSSALEWLRLMARQRPQVQLQVLVTGSLYLVGDVLRLLGKAPK